MVPFERAIVVDIVYKRNRVDIFCRLCTIHERDRQTYDITVTSIPIGEIASHRCRLIIIMIKIFISPYDGCDHI